VRSHFLLFISAGEENFTKFLFVFAALMWLFNVKNHLRVALEAPVEKY
jgi:hypothetical protein